MSGESIFNDVDSIYINNKEVQSIKRVDDGAIIYEKIMILGEPLEFIFEGTTLTQDSNGLFSGTNMIIDYGDGTIEPTTGKFGHTYSKNGTYQVKIYGVTNLNQNCFRYCTGLTSIEIPNSVSSIGDYCFHGCTGLTSIIIPDSVTSLGDYCFYGCTSLNNYYLNWISSSTIIAYNSNKMPNNTNTIFHIPERTKPLYISNGYPSDKLQNNIPFNDFTFAERTGKKILSQADGDKAYLDVQLTSEGSPVAVAGVDVEFYNDDILIDTVQTDSDGKASYEYTSVGAGDIVFEAKTSSLVSKTYTVEDCKKYFGSAISHSGNGSDQYWNDYTISSGDLSSLEVSFKLKSTANGCGVAISGQTNGLTNAFGFAIGSGSAIHCWSNGENTTANLGNYTANTDLNCKITFENGTVKYYVSDELKDTQTLVGSPIYFIVRSWTNSKTVTVTDLKFKPL